MKTVDGQQKQDRVVAGEDEPVGGRGHKVHERAAIIILFAAVAAFPWLYRWASWAFVSAYCVSAAASLVLVAGQARAASLRTLLILAIPLRLLFIFASPELSKDVYRYLWDGHVAAAGIDPYEHPPESPALSPLREPWHARINHPEIRTIYPPLAQMFFILVAWVSSSVLAWKLVVLAFDLTTLSLLNRLSAPAAFAWALSPLVIVEGIWSGHLEIVVSCCLVAAVVLFSRSPGSFGAALMLAAAAGLKLTPFAALAPFVRSARKKSKFLLVFMLMILLPGVFYVNSPHLMSGLGAYARRWSFNSPLYDLLRMSILETGAVPVMRAFWGRAKEVLDLEPVSDLVYRHLYPDFVTRMLLGVLLLGALFLVHGKRLSVTAGSASMIGTLLLFTPTIHPWYWLPVLALALIERQWLWILLATLSPVSYLLYSSHTVMTMSAYAVGYGVPFAFLAILLHRKRARADRV